MSLDRVPGNDDVYIGSAFALNRRSTLDSHNITHILSVVECMPSEKRDNIGRTRLCIDVFDTEDDDILVHLPQCVRFIESGLRPGSVATAPDKTRESAADAGSSKLPGRPGAVYVHCAMGKSRSATAVIAYLLWKHPRRFAGGADDGGSSSGSAGASSAFTYPPLLAEAAVTRALAWLRQARPMVEPNPGFMKQLAMWWRMGCPADSDDAVEREPAYQRWLYHREVEESTRYGRAPPRLWFRDEDQPPTTTPTTSPSAQPATSTELRCKKCRTVLATARFTIPHQWQAGPAGGSEAGSEGAADTALRPCAHYFIEPLSWMRPVLEEGALEGRLVCPNKACAASVGRFAWQGLQCSCREWVCPAFSLQRSRVDEVARPSPASRASADSRLGIRLPPGNAARPGLGSSKV